MPDETDSTKVQNKRRRLVLVGLFFALMFIYASLNAYQTLKFLRSYPGWQPRRVGDRLLIRDVTPSGPASALRYGDEIVSFNGRPITDVSRSSIFDQEPETPYTIGILRGGQSYEFSFRMIPVPLSVWLMLFALTVLLPTVGLSTGLTVFLLKPDDKRALLLAILFAVFIPPMAYHWYEGLPQFLAWVMYVGPLITPLAFVLVLHFFLIFPEPSPLLRHFPRFERWLYLPYLLIILPRDLLGASAWGISQGKLLDALAGTLILLCFTGAFVSMLVNYRRADELAKRKLRVIVAGMLVGMLPGVIVFFALAPWFDLSRISPTLAEWLPPVAALAFLIMPVSFAYAIARHQVIPVSLMIRRSVQYLLAKNALRVTLALPIIGIALTILSNPNRTISELLFRNSIYFYFLVIVAAALGLLFRKRLSRWVDRKFFRETYDQEKILRALVDDVKRQDSIPEMSKRVTERVGAALHPEQIYLFYREEESRNLSLSYTSGGTSHELKIPEEFQLPRFMELQGSAQDFPFPQKNNLPQSEKAWLAQLDTSLIVPMSGTDNRLSGLLLLGSKKSEVPYTKSDRELLETLAGQIAIVYENVRLKTRVDRERKVRHEVLSRVAGQNLNLLKECPCCGSCFDMNVQTCARDGAELTLSLPVERTVEGRYRLDRLLGKGGMGAVYEATDTRLQRKVAVKILTGSMFGNSDALRRFEREAQASARLHHPNIISIHDYGVLSTEGAYLVMELVVGETFAARIKREGQLSTSIAADLFNQILEGIKAAHAAGIIHRDLKPENILLSTEADSTHVHILDFGLAKLTQAVAADSQSPTAPDLLTTPGAVMGTFGYMSPEQLTGGHVDERSDLFSIGVMVVETLTGRRPFTGKTYHELLTQILQNTFHLQDDSPAAKHLDAILQKCLAKNARERYSSAREMQRELIPAIQNCQPLLFIKQKAIELDADTAIF